jgi:hypothetical protein
MRSTYEYLISEDGNAFTKAANFVAFERWSSFGKHFSGLRSGVHLSQVGEWCTNDYDIAVNSYRVAKKVAWTNFDRRFQILLEFPTIITSIKHGSKSSVEPGLVGIWREKYCEFLSEAIKRSIL